MSEFKDDYMSLFTIHKSFCALDLVQWNACGNVTVIISITYFPKEYLQYLKSV